MSRFKANILIYATLTIGLGSMILFSLFLFIGSFTVIDLGLDRSQALVADALLSLLFFLQHSIMVRKGVRMGLANLIPDDYYSAFYAFSSGITLLFTMLLWQKIPGPIVTAGGVYCWMLRALFFVCIAGFHWGAKSLGSFDTLGIKKIQRSMRNKETRAMPLTVKGPYRWVRHPLYFFMLLMIWSCPVLTADRLLFNIIWSIWIVAATTLEERDLVYEFGDQYRSYQMQVPMILPYRIPRHSIQRA